MLFLALLFAQAVAFSESSYPQDDIKQREGMVTQWDQQASIQSLLEIMVIVLGAAITVVQGFQKGWCKPATIAMGAGTTIFSAVNTKVLPTDRRELRAAVVEGNRLVTKMHRRARALNEAATPEAKTALALELEEVLGKFDDLAVRVSGGDKGKAEPQTGSRLFNTPVYAMAANDNCGLKLKSDSLRFYYLGTNRNVSVTQAKRLSHRDAIDRAAKELTPKGLDQAIVRDMLEKLAVVDDTAYNSDPKTGQYTYCTLIRINKTALNLLRTAPPAKAKSMRIEPGQSRRLSSVIPAFLYLRKVQNHGTGPSVAEVYILESEAPEWMRSELNGPAFRLAIAKMSDRGGGQIARESYVYREVKKGDRLVLKFSGGQDTTINFVDVKYVLARVDFTVTGI